MQTRSGYWYIIKKEDAECNQSAFRDAEQRKNVFSTMKLVRMIDDYQNEYIYKTWSKYERNK